MVERAYAAINDGDFDGFLAAVHPDVEFRSLIAEADDRTFRGHAGVRQWWESVRGALGGLTFEAEDWREAGDRVVNRVRVTGHIDGVDIPQTMWMAGRVQDGRAIWWQTFRSEREAVEATGLVA